MGRLLISNSWITAMRSIKGAIFLSWAIALFGQASPTHAGSQWHVCQPVDVAAFTTRVHVKCQTSAAGGIKYFAVRSSEPFSKNFLAIANSALVSGKSLQVKFDSSRSGENYGCSNNNCRPAEAIAIFR